LIVKLSRVGFGTPKPTISMHVITGTKRL
jgi:hypothetical protein